MKNKRSLEDLMCWEIPYNQEFSYMSHILRGINRELTTNVREFGIKFRGLNVLFEVNPIYFNDKISSHNQQVACILHNTLHFILKHPLRYSKIYNKAIFDIAADIVVNQLAKTHDNNSIYVLENTATLEHFPHFKLEPNQTLEYYYHILNKEYHKTQQQKQNQQGNDNNESDNSDNNDSNKSNESGKSDKSDKSNKSDKSDNSNDSDKQKDSDNENGEGKQSDKSNKGNDKSKEQGLNESQQNLEDFVNDYNGENDSDNNSEDSNNSCNDGNSSDGNDNKGKSGKGKGGKPKHDWEVIDDKTKEIMDNHVDDMIMNAHDNHKNTTKGRGFVPGYMQDIINLIITSRTPVFDWKQELKRFISNSTKGVLQNTMKRVSKRYGTNPGFKKKKFVKILVAVDTSGSVSKDDLEEFFSEIRNIWARNPDITIIECDAAVGNIYPYKGHPPTTISGRGGY